jgi:hypothetical protein
MSATGRAHTMPHFTKRRKTAADHPLQRDKSNQPTIFQIAQDSTAHPNSPLHQKP